MSIHIFISNATTHILLTGTYNGPGHCMTRHIHAGAHLGFIQVGRDHRRLLGSLGPQSLPSDPGTHLGSLPPTRTGRAAAGILLVAPVRRPVRVHPRVGVVCRVRYLLLGLQLPSDFGDLRDRVQLQLGLADPTG